MNRYALFKMNFQKFHSIYVSVNTCNGQKVRCLLQKQKKKQNKTYVVDMSVTKLLDWRYLESYSIDHYQMRGLVSSALILDYIVSVLDRWVAHQSFILFNSAATGRLPYIDGNHCRLSGCSSVHGWELDVRTLWNICSCCNRESDHQRERASNSS